MATKDNKNARMTLYLSKALAEKLKEQAAKDGRSVNNFITKILREKTCTLAH